jgi:hypothetical protein|tara:strand:+ start:2401 stop:2850 length:450 start_codon:yes stop_codon:yes gene_type:complete
MKRKQRKELNEMIKNETHNTIGNAIQFTISQEIGWTIFILVGSCFTLWSQINDFNTIENNVIQKLVTIFINVFFMALITLFLSYFLKQYYASLDFKEVDHFYAVWDMMSPFFGFMCFCLAIIEIKRRKILNRKKNDKHIQDQILESLES